MAGVWILNASAFTIETNFENAVQYIQSIFVTDNGKPTGNLFVAMNTWGTSLMVNGSTKFVGDVNISGTLNAHLNELDPKIGALQNGKLCTASGTSLITCWASELDPKIGSGTNGRICSYNSSTSKVECLVDGSGLSQWKQQEVMCIILQETWE